MYVTFFIGAMALLIYLDINSELDEMDREEFYRLKKVYLQ